MEDQLKPIASRIFRSALVPGKNYGNVVHVVSDEKVGRAAKMYRLKAGVRGSDVWRKLKISSSRLCFLETGRKAWDIKTLLQYLAAVESFRSEPHTCKPKKAQVSHLSK